jgi:hypothetical protein
MLDVLAAIGLLFIIFLPFWIYLLDRLGFEVSNSPRQAAKPRGHP